MKQRIGNQLLTAREGKNLTQADMAHLLGVPLTTYQHYERNESSVDYTKIVKFAEILKIPIQEMLPDTVAITNNNHNSGQGGGIIFGNQYFYLGDNIANQALSQENKELKERLALLEQKINELLNK